MSSAILHGHARKPRSVTSAARRQADNFWLGMRFAGVTAPVQSAPCTSVQLCCQPCNPARPAPCHYCTLPHGASHADAATVRQSKRVPSQKLSARLPAGLKCVLSKGCSYEEYCQALQRCQYARAAASASIHECADRRYVTITTTVAPRYTRFGTVCNSSQFQTKVCSVVHRRCAILDGGVQSAVNIITIMRPCEVGA